MPIKIDLKLKPKSNFEVPNNGAYQIYSSFLQIIKENNTNLSKKIHDSKFSNINISQLDGPFDDGKMKFHKRLRKNEEYALMIGITDAQEEDIFQGFFKQCVLENRNLNLENGDLILSEMKGDDISYEEFIEQSENSGANSLAFDFISPTCIEFRNSDITEMFPHRTAVFNSILSKWNKMSDKEWKIGLNRETIGKSLIEYPDFDSLNNHSVKVGSFYDEKKGHEQPKLKQGFKGECEYRFSSDVSKYVKNALTALSLFAEFSGVGSAVSRGCGSVVTEVNG